MSDDLAHILGAEATEQLIHAEQTAMRCHSHRERAVRLHDRDRALTGTVDGHRGETLRNIVVDTERDSVELIFDRVTFRLTQAQAADLARIQVGETRLDDVDWYDAEPRLWLRCTGGTRMVRARQIVPS